MKDVLEIREFISAHWRRDDLALCTIVKKTGSSYRDVGAMKVVARSSGAAAGLLSGGCLEAAIEKAAREGFEEMPFTMTFDMLSDSDRLLGYQTGCQGVIDIRFERINPAADLDILIPYDPIRLVIVGCGADADAYEPMAAAMGWKIEFIDYRSDLVNRFGSRARKLELGEIARHIPDGNRVAVVLMTHNYESDLEILKGLSERGACLGYLGCLGPARRFEQLKSDLKAIHGRSLGPDLASVIHAPVGIFGHSRSPAEIALSVVAQIQKELIESPRRLPWTLILAAGDSRRFGSPKALAQLGGRTFIQIALDVAREFSDAHVLVVTGAEHERVESVVHGAFVMFNENWSEGMGSSLRVGIKSVLARDPEAEGVAVLHVDQPFVTGAHLQALRRLGVNTDRCALTARGGDSGPPAYIPRSYFPALDLVSGDHGLKRHLKPSETIFLENPEAFADIDTPEELASGPG